MKTTLVLAALALCAALPAYANDDLVSQLSRETGVSERHVQMIVGSRTPFAEYTRSYDREFRRFSRALGTERTQELLSGGPIRLSSGDIVQLDKLPPSAG